MFVLWGVLFCFSLALTVMSIVDKTGWDFGARMFSMVFGLGLMVVFGYALYRSL